MSRLSLNPGGEPGRWIVQIIGVDGTWWDREITCYPVPDEDLIAIQSTLAEYFAAKEPDPVPFKPNGIYDPLGLLVPHWKRWSSRLAWVLVGCMISMVGFWYGWGRVPNIPVSTGGVIDQLCMRPDIECSTSIRYVHPQAGVPYQERETYSADSLSQAHLEEQ